MLALGFAAAPVAQPGQSKGLLIPRSQVRILPGAPNDGVPIAALSVRVQLARKS